MDVRILVKEFPFLKDFLDKKNFIQEMDVRKLGKELLARNLYENIHSWAGSYGVVAFLIFENGSFEKCKHGGWFCDNGRSVEDNPHIALWKSFIGKEGDVDNGKIRDIKAIVINDWNRFNNPANEYNEYIIFVRPRRKEISAQVEREIGKEINQLRDLVD